MPQLTIRGIEPHTAAAIAVPLVQELALVCACGTDNFTLDILQVTTVSVTGGQPTDTYPFIEVAWFERGQAVRDRFAETVTRHLRQGGVSEVEIAFKVYAEAAYYVNGEPCV